MSWPTDPAQTVTHWYYPDNFTSSQKIEISVAGGHTKLSATSDYTKTSAAGNHTNMKNFRILIK